MKKDTRMFLLVLFIYPVIRLVDLISFVQRFFRPKSSLNGVVIGDSEMYRVLKKRG